MGDSKLYITRTLQAAALATSVTLAGPAHADTLSLGAGWDGIEWKEGGVQFVLPQSAYLEFTTVIGVHSTFDFYLLGPNYTGSIGGWTYIGTNVPGTPDPDTNPPYQDPYEADFDAAWASPYASHGEWLITQPGAYEVTVSVDENEPGYSGQGGILGYRLVAVVPEPSTWAMMLLGFMGLGYAGYRRAKRNAPAFADERA